MDYRIYLINLYDFYGDLLTEKQKKYFEYYYFDNLSLAEISENNNISRNAVHKQIKEVETKLEMYEQKLNLYEKSKKIKFLIKDLDNNLKNKIEELL